MMHLEMTDTFGGEANYSWVKRHALDGHDTVTRRQAVMAAKAWAGWTGLRCKTEDCGGMVAIRPCGICQVLFITWE